MLVCILRIRTYSYVNLQCFSDNSDMIQTFIFDTYLEINN